MDKAKTAIIAAGATIVIVGGLIVTQVDKWFTPESTGPGSGDEVDRGNGPGEPGPGSGEEIIPGDPEFDPDYEFRDGKDHGNGINEPGPGSGDELPPDEVYTDGKDRGNGINQPGPGSGDELPSEEPTGPGSGDELPATVSSCNTIDDASTCIEYIGSYWATPSVAALNCDGVGVYSDKPCPRPMVGGCHTGDGTITEMVIWFYNYGGDPLLPDNVQNASGACNANPFASWISG